MTLGDRKSSFLFAIFANSSPSKKSTVYIDDQRQATTDLEKSSWYFYQTKIENSFGYRIRNLLYMLVHCLMTSIYLRYIA